MKTYLRKSSAKANRLKLAGVGLLLVLAALACGTAATPTPTVKTPAPSPAPAKAVATPTPAPTPKVAPVAPTVAKGKVTILSAPWGNEWFYPEGGLGEVAGYGRALHAMFVEGTERTELIPGVLTKWDISPDGSTWTLTMRREPVKFHNGDVMTIDDVFFSLDHVAGTATVGDVFAGAERVAIQFKNMAITGPNTMDISHKTTVSYFAFYILSALGPANFGGVIPKKYFEQVGLEGYNKAPVGAGAFKMVTYRPKEQMLMERFDEYYYRPENGLPEDRRSKFKTLDLRLVPEASTRVAALRSGEADIAQANLAVAKQVEGGGGRIIFAKESSYYWIFPAGCWKPELVCSNQKVRLALDYAIDKELISRQFYGGGVGEAKGYVGVTPSSLGYSPELDPFPYDPAKAKALLREAGFPDGRGIPKMAIHTWQAGDVPFLPEVGQVIADMWKRNLGIDVELIVSDATSVKVRWQSRELDGNFILRSNEARFDGLSLAAGSYTTKQTEKGRRAEDPALQDLVQRTAQVIDPAKKHEAYNQMWKVLREAGYEFSLGYVNQPWGVGPRIAEWRPWPLTAYQTALWTIILK